LKKKSLIGYEEVNWLGKGEFIEEVNGHEEMNWLGKR
jgi:hypothetical protein